MELYLNRTNETFHLQRKGWRDEDAGWIVEVRLVLNSFIPRGRGCSVTKVAICGNVGQDCGNGTIPFNSTEKTVEGNKKQLIGIWTEKTGFSLEKVEQIMNLPSSR
ncbi:hypothetical protein AVEN_256045-1 [Araneus ventricosus]|uniref:Uncharacterized protein n=1 Tax=Araneus ventricosus TaxID=182803 RepID=A0A4Y2R2A0_ARAVE|nr:hypothetical protein AVEN_142308-1 [Araneus ventricosus]GBN69721.1 hypothetical protein AVEN_256045-1 [Araneus ventricosus]